MVHILSIGFHSSPVCFVAIARIFHLTPITNPPNQSLINIVVGCEGVVGILTASHNGSHLQPSLLDTRKSHNRRLYFYLLDYIGDLGNYDQVHRKFFWSRNLKILFSERPKSICTYVPAKNNFDPSCEIHLEIFYAPKISNFEAQIGFDGSIICLALLWASEMTTMMMLGMATTTTMTTATTTITTVTTTMTTIAWLSFTLQQRSQHTFKHQYLKPYHTFAMAAVLTTTV